MSKTFDNGQLRGAYAAGLEAGLKAGIERMRLEGWRRWQPGDRVPDGGEMVKTLDPTIGGWLGFGRVVIADEDSIEIAKPENYAGLDTHSLDRILLCTWQVAVKWVKDA